MAAELGLEQPAFITLRAGDRVLITMKEEPNEADAQQYLDYLHKGFPGVKFILFGGVSGVLVQGGGE